MRPKIYVVELRDDEQTRLRQMLNRGSEKARTLTRARILLLAHAGQTDAQIVAALQTSMSTVGRMRTQYATCGLDAALYEAPRPGASGHWMGSRKPIWSPLPVVIRRMVGVSGQCNCWRTTSWRWG